MSLKIYNTLTRRKEVFTPLVPGRIRMYVCGITPYDDSHIGHARSAVVFDVIARYLRYRYRDHVLTVVKNYTDIDDKIIARASQLETSAAAVADQYIAAYEHEMRALGIAAPTHAPRATRHIPQMLRLIERLVAEGVAYVVDGDVYFEVRRFRHYGRLSGKDLDELLAGARVQIDERKRDPRDFSLWKAARPGEPSWPSPWGPGRPGWHIECSAMSMEYLGETFDIHGGGEDLVFPHHECEIAQSEAATGKPFVRYWIHHGLVKLRAEKMSKSCGNIVRIEALLARHDAEALRLYLLQTHYRNPVEFTEDRVDGMRRPLERFRELVDAAQEVPAGPEREPDSGFVAQVASFRERFTAGLDDDFNTPQAVAALIRLASALAEERERVRAGFRTGRQFVTGVGVLIELGRVLGLSMEGAQVRLVQSLGPDQRAHIDRLVRERDEARKQRDWARADVLRVELDALGITLQDSPTGTAWKPRTPRRAP